MAFLTCREKILCMV